MNSDPETTASVAVAILLDRKVSLFGSCKTKEPPSDISVGDFLRAVQQGRWREPVERIRAMGKTEADRLKVKTLPIVKPSGRFGTLRADSLIEHSGVLCLDFDELGATLEQTAQALQRDTHTLAVFRSPRGCGLKVFVAVAASDAGSHRLCFNSAQACLAGCVDDPRKIDTHPTNISANCFASWDAVAWWRTDGNIAVFPSTPTNRETSREKSPFFTTCGIIFENEYPLSPSSQPILLGAEECRGSGVKREEREEITESTPPRRFTPGVLKLYARWVAHFPASQGSRNRVIVRVVPRLVHVVGESVIVAFLARFYDEAGGVFRDSRQQHLWQVQAMIAGVLRSYATNPIVRLSQRERDIYESLRDDRRRAAFRILRALSRVKGHNGSLTMTENHLGDRLGCHQESAARVLESLVKAGVLEITERGKQWAPGMTQRSPTIYRWGLPLVVSNATTDTP